MVVINKRALLDWVEGAKNANVPDGVEAHIKEAITAIIKVIVSEQAYKKVETERLQ